MPSSITGPPSLNTIISGFRFQKRSHHHNLLGFLYSSHLYQPSERECRQAYLQGRPQLQVRLGQGTCRSKVLIAARDSIGEPRGCARGFLLSALLRRLRNAVEVLTACRPQRAKPVTIAHAALIFARSRRSSG